MNQFISRDSSASSTESLDPSGVEAIRVRIDQFAAQLSTTPRALKADERRMLAKALKTAGLLEVRKAMDTTCNGV